MSKKTVFLLALSVLLTGMAEAATVPANNSFMYTAYDIVVLKGIGGAPGYVVGAGGIAYSAGRAIVNGNVVGPLIGAVFSALLLAAPTIVESVGALY